MTAMMRLDTPLYKENRPVGMIVRVSNKTDGHRGKLRLVRDSAPSQFETVPYSQFVEKTEKINLNRPFGDVHFRRNLFIPQTLAKSADDLAFPRRERNLLSRRGDI